LITHLFIRLAVEAAAWVQGKRDEARNVLAPVYGWFTDGFDTRDLEEAKTLLHALTS
jgi:predicted ATPase